MSSVDASTFLPGAYSRRNPQGGTPNPAIPDVVPALIGRTLGKAVVVTDEAVTKGALDTADALTNADVRRIIKISDTLGGPANYTLGGQFVLTGDTVDWAASVFIPTPILETPVVTVLDGGTWGATGAHFFVITALNANGETVKSTQVSATVVTATDSVTLRWGRVPNATQYKVFETSITDDYTGSALLATIASGAE